MKPGIYIGYYIAVYRDYMVTNGSKSLQKPTAYDVGPI
jgi:hypothetical protein